MSKAIKGPKKSGPDPAIAAAAAKAAAAKKLADEQQAEALRKAKASQGRSSLGNPGGDDTAARVGKTTLGA
jgi:hypothetical protein